MDLQTLSDRAEIVDLVSKYNKASFYCDVKGYADTFTDDGRYINANHGWVGFGGPEASDAIAAEYRQGTGLQHLCLDYLIEFVEPTKALVRHHMLMFQREGAHNPNQISNTGFYYRTVVRTAKGWRFSEIVSFVDRKMSDELVTNLRGLVLSRPVILASLSKLLEMGGDAILDAVRNREVFGQSQRWPSLRGESHRYRGGGISDLCAVEQSTSARYRASPGLRADARSGLWG